MKEYKVICATSPGIPIKVEETINQLAEDNWVLSGFQATCRNHPENMITGVEYFAMLIMERERG